YCVTHETRSTVNMVGIGVFVHEFGHILGLPDLYDVSYVSEGIGNWGVMGGGCWLNGEKTPCHFDAWSKMQLGWQQPLVISQEKTYTLPACVDSNISFKILTPNSNEYFLLENMQKRKFDTYLPGKGLAIWHINTYKTSLYPGNNSINTDTTDQGVSLTEADGLRHLDRGSNQGDPGDLFPGAKSKRIFEDESYPSAKMNDGFPSGVKVTEIFETNGIISFYLGKRASNSVQDLEADQLIVYPNPVNQGSNLILRSSKPLTGAFVTISDINGKVLKQVFLPDTATLLQEVSVKELSAGIYLMQVSDNTGTTQVKKITIY
ncbi:MAG: immune inhibitor A, partial [Bacteroidia bacterium]|nr:immune inhibitor A [Bacteroidia bacterium]